MCGLMAMFEQCLLVAGFGRPDRESTAAGFGRFDRESGLADFGRSDQESWLADFGRFDHYRVKWSIMHVSSSVLDPIGYFVAVDLLLLLPIY